jgi:putative salt-induced outer membrane protein YdiY
MQRNSYCLLTLFIIIFLLFPSISSAKTIYERKVSLGGQLSGGNSRVNSLDIDFLLSRDRKLLDEVTTKGNFDYESTDGADTVFKGYMSFRYACSISKISYRFTKLEFEHDRFQDIDLRVIPTIGIGLWLVKDDLYQLLVEGAIGYQRNYLINQVGEEMVVIKLGSLLLVGPFSNDFDIYIDSADFSNFRFVNKTVYKVKINTHYAFKWTLKDEYNNRPAGTIQKNDLSFKVGLEYALKLVEN